MIVLRIPRDIYVAMRKDLDRPHPFAAERVGFAYVRHSIVAGRCVVLFLQYIPVEDQNYIHASDVGAKINSTSIRGAMQECLTRSVGCFHVHHHPHEGPTWLSSTDRAGIPPMIESFSQLKSDQVHGILVLTDDDATAFAWTPAGLKCQVVEKITVVGIPVSLMGGAHEISAARAPRFSRTKGARSI